MANPALFKPLVVLELIWKETGWGTIIILAALRKIRQQEERRRAESTSEDTGE